MADDGRAGGAASLRLAHLLATRLCHDLSGPLGGLCAALGEVPGDPDALPLALDATLALRRRLELARLAWGDPPVGLDRARLAELAAGLPNAARLRLELAELAAAPAFRAAAARVVLNALLLAADSLHGIGMVALAGDPAGQVLVTIAGQRATWPVGLGAMLANPGAAWDAVAALAPPPAGLRQLAAPLTALLARAAGVRAALLLAGRPEQAPPLLLDFAAVADD
jgi:histidine phosphotransferase ChpT